MLENLHGCSGLLSCILGAVQSITSFFKRYMNQFLRAMKGGKSNSNILSDKLPISHGVPHRAGRQN